MVIAAAVVVLAGLVTAGWFSYSKYMRGQLPADSAALSFLTNGLVAYYPLNGNANDASKSGFNGVVSSNCRFVPDRFGKLNSALFITNDQSSDSIDVGRIDIPASAVNSLSAGTITAWINPSDVRLGDVAAKQHSGANSYAIFSIGGFSDGEGQPVQGNPGTLYFHSQNSSQTFSFPVAASSTAVVPHAWQLVAVVFTTNSCSFCIDPNSDIEKRVALREGLWA